MVIPNTVRWAAITWAGAVAAGAIESILALSRAASAGPLVPSIWAGIGVRFVIYTLATTLIVNFWRGRRWARGALTVLLTVIGLASLVVPAVLAMLDGQTFLQALSDGGALGWAFVLVRLTHIACVVSASILMFTTSSNRYFAAAKRRHANVATAGTG